MVLCVFDISWPESRNNKADGALPEFVLTDGWYKIRAQVDQALAKAANKGKIRIGTKLSIMGAKVCCATIHIVKVLNVAVFSLMPNEKMPTMFSNRLIPLQSSSLVTEHTSHLGIPN